MLFQPDALDPARRLSSRNWTLKSTRLPWRSEPVNLTVKFSVGPSLVETDGQEAETVGLRVDLGVVVVGGGVWGTVVGGGLVAAGGADVGGGAVGEGGLGLGMVKEGNAGSEGTWPALSPVARSEVIPPAATISSPTQIRRMRPTPQATFPFPEAAVSTTP
jgi:hypothetical protein